MKVTEEARVFGAKDQEQPSWQDTNMALFGSDVETKIKAAAAQGEPQWTGPPKAGTEKGLQIWRIEKFKVVPWPKSRYGDFYTGDSYIVLNTYCPQATTNPDRLAWDVHFWIGSESTQDEYGTAAYKTVELDDFLGRKAIQYREVQDFESKKFTRYFPRGIKYLKGGVASGFTHVEAEDREPVLLRLKGRGNNTRLTQIECKRSAMNSGDVFILDCNEGIYQWNGTASNAYERARAAEVCSDLREKRAKAEFICFEEGSARSLDPSHPFVKHLPIDKSVACGASAGVRSEAAGGSDEDIAGFKKSVYMLELSPEKRGEIGIVPIKSGTLPRELLNSLGVYVVDSGFHLFLWVGMHADFALRITAFVFAQAYLKRFNRPTVLPLTRFAEGQESQKFLWLFQKPKGYRIDAKPKPERYHPLMRRAEAPKKVVAATYKPVSSTQSAPSAGGPPKPIAQVEVASSLVAPASLKIGGEEQTPTEASTSTEDEDEDEEPPPPLWQEIDWKEKCKCIDGTCYPIVSDAWGCCLTSCGCSWKDRVACLGLDCKGLYSPCVQVECMACKPAFDKGHPEVCCVFCQGYTYGVVPEAKCCKGSEQICCCQNRCSLPCDDEVPSTCTFLGHQRCQRSRKTGYNLELVPFLPYPEVRIMDDEVMKRGGKADDFNLPWCCKSCLDSVAKLNTSRDGFGIFNACCGYVMSIGFDFPSCCGSSILGTCLCCCHIDCVCCKPVERHPRVECIFCQGGTYLAKPWKGPCCGYTLCKGTATSCCLEHRYAYPPDESMQAWPCRCTLLGGQICTFDPQHECNRKCCVKISALPRVKPAVAESSDVLYHETRKADLKAAADRAANRPPTSQGMQRL